MKLPALWIAASFAVGIAIATRWPVSPNLWFAGAIAAMLCGAGLLWSSKAPAAWVLALVAWVALGGLAICMERAASLPRPSRPPNGRPPSFSLRSPPSLPRIRSPRISIAENWRSACSTSARAIRFSPRFPADAQC